MHGKTTIKICNLFLNMRYILSVQSFFLSKWLSCRFKCRENFHFAKQRCEGANEDTKAAVTCPWIFRRIVEKRDCKGTEYL
jgi:hypothetical protein